MRERRRRAAAEGSPTALALEWEPRLEPHEGIPLLLMPEHVVVLVDASLLTGPLAATESEDRGVRGLQRLGRGLARSWVDCWDV
jgi:hypothetical protein